MFPNGCGMGATFDKRVIHAAGRVLGLESRGLHNYFLNENDRGANCNGCGITIYGPNLVSFGGGLRPSCWRQSTRFTRY